MPTAPVAQAGVLHASRVQDIQRGRILTALVQVVGEHGVRTLSVAQIVSRAGVSRRTFYELFENTEECFLAALDRAIEQAAAAVLPAYRSQLRWQDRIRAGLTALLELLDDYPHLGRLLFVESLAGGAPALERRSAVVAQLVAAIDEGRQAGTGAPPPLAAEAVVGGVWSILHSRLLAPQPQSLLALASPLMSMIVLPYLGGAAMRTELRHPAPRPRAGVRPARNDGGPDPIKQLGMRMTYRTARVLMAVAEAPGATNRRIGADAGISDQGQVSKLLKRLSTLGLIDNDGEGPQRRLPNAWRLTPQGEEVRRLIAAVR